MYVVFSFEFLVYFDVPIEIVLFDISWYQYSAEKLIPDEKNNHRILVKVRYKENSGVIYY